MNSPLRILFAEDVPTDHELAEWQLRSEGVVFVSQRVDTPSEFSRALIEFKPDLVISDFSMPEFNGMQALQILQRSNIDIPFVMLTGSVNEDTAVMCMKAGASDYVIKEHINKLPFAVKESLKRHAILKEKEEAVQQLRESEAKFRSLFENNHAVMLLVDPESGEIVDANPAAAEFYGYSQVELLNKRISDINAHNPEEISEKQIRAAARQTHFSFQHRLANGEVRDVEVFSGPIRHGGKTLLYSIIHDITARKLAEAALERKNKLQEMMAVLGRDLATTLDLKKIYQIAGRHLRAMIDCPNIGITLFNAERQTLTAAYAVTEGMIVDPANLPPHPYDPQDARGGRSKAITSKTPVIETHHPSEEFGVLLGERTAIYVPILVEDQVIGLVEIHDLKQTESTPEDGEWLSIVANQIGLAIQNARQYEKTRQRVAELLLQHTIDQTITGSDDPAEIYNKILDIILSQPYSDAADILILNPQNQTLEFAAGRGFFTSNIEGTTQPFRCGLAGKVFTEKRTVEVFDLSREEDPIIFHKDVWTAEDFHGYIGLPLILHQEVKGVLEIFTRQQAPAEPGWVQFMESVAQQVSIAVNNSQLFQNLFQSNQELVQAYDATIAGWSKAMDLRDEETEGHTERVTSLTLRIAEAMGIPAEKMEHVRRGALLHDIGKLGVPDHVLLKIGPLTDTEWEIMRKHPVFAYEMLAPIEYLQPALDIPYCHHERWDGTGYPRGLSGEEIPLEARIFALVDVFDALTSDRPYRSAWSKKQTLAYIAEQSGKQFDPRITAAFLKLIEEEPDWSA